jgi:hypothetical protein
MSTLLLPAPSGHAAAVAAVGIIQQRDFGESRGRIHARPLVDADDPLRCPTAAEVTSALVMPGRRQ